MMLIDLGFLFLLASATLLIQLLGLPLLLIFFNKTKPQPEWWAWGRLVGLLVISLIIWFLAHLGLPANTTTGFWLVFIGLLALIYFRPNKTVKQQVRLFLKTHGQQILTQEIIFLAGFIFLGLVRTFHPAVLDLEKFMNAGLIQGYLRSPTLPAIDFWLAGETINYYSFGHFWASLLLRFWHLPVEVGFNVLLGLVMGLVLVQSYALSQSLLRNFLPGKPITARPLVLAGLITGLLIVFGGNSHPVWYFFSQLSFKGYWYPDVTRFIEHTIHEIPAYSFIVSDLHAHFLSLPIVLLTIFMAWQWLAMITKPSQLKKLDDRSYWQMGSFLKTNLGLGGLLGILGMSNTWDMLVYSVFLVSLSSLLMIVRPKLWPAIMIAGLQVAMAGLIIILPWYLNFSAIVAGIFWVTERSPLWQWVALWAGHLLFASIASLVAWRLAHQQRPVSFEYLFLVSLGLCAWLFLILPEIIYFKDIYPTFPRANTMFKFAFQAFLMMNLLVGWLAGILLANKLKLLKPWRWLLAISMLIFLCLVLAYPFLGYPNYYDGFKQRTGLNGLAWLASSAPQEYQAIQWLRNQTGRPVLLEAVGDSYTEYGRASVFSGLPTVLGWRAHQWLWRGGYELPKLRTEEVKLIYEQPTSAKANSILTKYQLKFILVGSKERATYQLDLDGLESLGTVVFKKGRVMIIERTL